MQINHKYQDGFTLPYLLVTFLLVTTLIYITMNFFYLYNKYEIRKYNKKKLDLACYSAVQRFISEDKVNITGIYKLKVDSVNVLLTGSYKGLYYQITALAKYKQDSSCVTYLTAEKITFPFNNAVVISKPGLNATVAGNTKIIGNILGTTNKIAKGNITGIGQTNSNYLEGKINVAVNIFPKLFNDSLFMNIITQTKKTWTSKSKVITENMIIDNNYFSQYDSVLQYYVYGNLSITGSLSNHNTGTKQIFVTGTAIIDNNVKSNKDLEIYCDSSVVINSNSSLENLIVYAKNKIQIKPGVVCKNVQFYSEKGIECEKTIMNYPSIMCLYVNPKDTSKQKSTITINSSHINGSIMLISSEIASAKNKSKILIDANSKIQGLIYSENNVDISSPVVGTVYTYGFYFYKKPTEYVNWFVDQKIDRNSLDNSFLLPLGFNKTHKLEILSEKWEY
jgi:hypothetical protein